MHWSWRSEVTGQLNGVKLLGLTTWSSTLGGEELSQVQMLRLTLSIGVRTSKLKWSSVRSEATFSWMEEQNGYVKSREIKMTRLGVNQHQAGYWIDLVNTKALLGQNGFREALANPQWCGSKVDTNQGVPLGGSERYASAIKGDQAGIWNNEERLLIINLREAVSFRARMWLVVVTRL
jgi:hypothetical protein